MKPSSEPVQSPPTPPPPATGVKKTKWVAGLTHYDLDVLRHYLTEVKSVEPPANEGKPRAIKVSPVELAHLASQLAMQYCRTNSAQRYFCAAEELIRLADFYLKRNRCVTSAQRVVQAERDINEGYVAIPIALQAISSKAGEKKGRTQLGNISTRNGLVKAMKRLFGEEHINHIVRRTFRIKGRNLEEDAIHETTIARILEDQRQANKRRGQSKLKVNKNK